ncbi:hypothetical protein RHGRI_017183 [Rhododendron griersonianum]|uniref:Transmembrane protein 18 n=1 Tax=Rhododendron griersonianum TaxID=479676 RepID=A0AAV6JWU1_9ERIC|nr:hypothetical protein RHGRI_017183 [Rhododendron griersonianum]
MTGFGDRTDGVGKMGKGLEDHELGQVVMAKGFVERFGGGEMIPTGVGLDENLGQIFADRSEPPMEDLKSAMGEHMDQMADLVEKLTAELRSGLRPAYDNFLGFFHAIDWTNSPMFCLRWNAWLGLAQFAVINLRALANVLDAVPFCVATDSNYVKEEYQLPDVLVSTCIHGVGFAKDSRVGKRRKVAGVYFAETLNSVLRDNWKSFAGQDYFDPRGLFLSVLWSGPLLVIAIIILVNTLFSLCHLIVRWKKAELRHRARLSRNKED